MLNSWILKAHLLSKFKRKPLGQSCPTGVSGWWARSHNRANIFPKLQIANPFQLWIITGISKLIKLRNKVGWIIIIENLMKFHIRGENWPKGKLKCLILKIKIWKSKSWWIMTWTIRGISYNLTSFSKVLQNLKTLLLSKFSIL